MKKNWNKEILKRKYLRILEDAKEKENFSDEELESPYLDKLSHQTKSPRITRMIVLAYTLGRLRMLQEIDDGYTPITSCEDLKEEKNDE